MSATFVPNPAGIASIPSLPAFAAAMLELGNQIAQAAQSSAPVLTGAYRNAIESVPHPPGVRVQATDYKSAWIEFGTGYPAPTPAFAVLQNAAGAAGI